jgi:hypothetical protein
VPPEEEDESTTSLPRQTGDAPLAVTAGTVFTTTLPDAVEIQPPLVVTVTTYAPEEAVTALNAGGFCTVELKLLGPDHV